MAILLSVLLIILGIIGLGSLIEEKIPALKGVVASLRGYQDVIGFAGLGLGTLLLFQWLFALPYFNYGPLRILLALVVILLTTALGLILGLDFVRKNLKDPNISLIVKAESLRVKLIPHQRNISFAAIVAGILDLAINL